MPRQLVKRLVGAVLVLAVAPLACGGGDDDAGSSRPRCLTIKDQFDQLHNLCCKEPDEVATYRVGCGQHVAIGCEGSLYCTFYTDDDEATHACMMARTCGDCARYGDSGLELWCHDKILE